MGQVAHSEMDDAGSFMKAESYDKVSYAMKLLSEFCELAIGDSVHGPQPEPVIVLGALLDLDGKDIIGRDVDLRRGIIPSCFVDEIDDLEAAGSPCPI